MEIARAADSGPLKPGLARKTCRRSSNRSGKSVKRSASNSPLRPCGRKRCARTVQAAEVSGAELTLPAYASLQTKRGAHISHRDISRAYCFLYLWFFETLNFRQKKA